LLNLSILLWLLINYLLRNNLLGHQLLLSDLLWRRWNLLVYSISHLLRLGYYLLRLSNNLLRLGYYLLRLGNNLLRLGYYLLRLGNNLLRLLNKLLDLRNNLISQYLSCLSWLRNYLLGRIILNVLLLWVFCDNMRWWKIKIIFHHILRMNL
jgi:hypothetical protein